MYYIYGISGPSLLIESTDSMIIATISETQGTCTGAWSVMCCALQRFMLEISTVNPSFVIQHINVSIRTIV